MRWRDNFDEYQKHIEKDAALNEGSLLCSWMNPSVDDTIKMMGLRDKYEAHHSAHFFDDAWLPSNSVHATSPTAACPIKPLI